MPLCVSPLVLTVLAGWFATEDTEDKIESLAAKGYRIMNDQKSEDRTPALPIWQEILRMEPLWADALVQVGLVEREDPDPEVREAGHAKFELAFSAKAKPKPLSIHPPPAYLLNTWIFQHHWKKRRYYHARPALAAAANSEAAKTLGDDCAWLQLATMLTAHPRSPEDARRVLDERMELLDLMLAKPSIDVSRTDHDDRFSYCMLSGFDLVLFYEADWREHASKYVRLGYHAFPSLRYEAPGLPRPAPPAPAAADEAADKTSDEAASARPIRLGVASAFWYPSSRKWGMPHSGGHQVPAA